MTIHSFIEMKFFFRVSFSSFAINFHSEMLKAWDGPFAERIFLATNNTKHPACVYLRFIVMALFLSSIITKSIVLSSFYVLALTMPFISHFINSDENKFFCNAINHALSLFVRYRRSGNQMKATSIDKISFFYSYSKVYTR